MYEIKVTVEIPGLPEALNSLAAALLGNGNADKKISKPVDTTPAAAPSDPIEQTAAPVTPAAPVAAPAPTPAKTYSLDDLSRAGAGLIDQGKMPQLLELLGRYGVQAVTQLDTAVYPAFVEELKALGAKL